MESAEIGGAEELPSQRDPNQPPALTIEPARNPLRVAGKLPSPPSDLCDPRWVVLGSADAGRLTLPMDDTSRRKLTSRPDPLTRRRLRCCSFAMPPSSPPNSISIHHSKALRHGKAETQLAKPAVGNSIPSSPQNAKSWLGLVGRILSPGGGLRLADFVSI
ncbi:hypothetical protein TIFTF001_006208 [Ficus carica]|uniref:Uncharacterized protein n=1 Tax=Ficus carica TaxID=3494 RepID=A0AA88AA11_FICCA|nr:hypothetical protein TIFTF001_006208 [Ficus carica]